MNLDQLNSLIRTVLKVIGSALMTHGLTNYATFINSPDVIGLVLLVGGMIWSHYTHASSPTSSM